MTDQLQTKKSVLVYYQFPSLIIDKYIRARNADLLPAKGTATVLAMNGDMGYNLYGAFKTLQLQGRFSRTMMEHLLMSNAYPEYIKLYIASLPVDSRSRYAADLYNNKFEGIEWDDKMYNSIHSKLVEGGVSLPKALPIPLGDHFHTPDRALVALTAWDFYELLNCGILFNGGGMDAPLDPDYAEGMVIDTIETFGPVFGIQKQELDFSNQRPNNGRSMSKSEVVLRTWNVLYLSERLCRTELEHALLNGPNAMKDLFCTGADLAGKFFPNANHSSMLQQAEAIMEDIVFEPLTPTAESTERAVDFARTCDYCGDRLEKVTMCGKCHVAQYCGKDCQRPDWIRHKPLCSRYCNETNSNGKD